MKTKILSIVFLLLGFGMTTALAVEKENPTIYVYDMKAQKVLGTYDDLGKIVLSPKNSQTDILLVWEESRLGLRFQVYGNPTSGQVFLTGYEMGEKWKNLNTTLDRVEKETAKVVTTRKVSFDSSRDQQVIQKEIAVAVEEIISSVNSRTQMLKIKRRVISVSSAIGTVVLAVVFLFAGVAD